MTPELQAHLAVLKQRRDYLHLRIAAKRNLGWESQWDEREAQALDAAISTVHHTNPDRHERVKVAAHELAKVWPSVVRPDDSLIMLLAGRVVDAIGSLSAGNTRRPPA